MSDKYLDKQGLVKYSKKTKEYVKNYVDTKVPDPPVANGDYVLQVTVNNGSVSYSWVSTANLIVDNQNSGN